MGSILTEEALTLLFKLSVISVIAGFGAVLFAAAIAILCTIKDK